jgi:hypothetical protein
MLLPQVLLDHNFGAKVLPADGTSGSAMPGLGPRAKGLGIHDAQVGMHALEVFVRCSALHSSVALCVWCCKLPY